jgi:hypothetical protein
MCTSGLYPNDLRVKNLLMCIPVAVSVYFNKPWLVCGIVKHQAAHSPPTQAVFDAKSCRECLVCYPLRQDAAIAA